MYRLHKRISYLTRGNKKTNLESIIKENNIVIQELQKKYKTQQKRIINIENESKNYVRYINVIRYNPFKETGGNQSFVVSFINKNNNGVVISSLFARDRINILAKPIIQGTSEYPLSEEEKKVIKHQHN